MKFLGYELRKAVQETLGEQKAHVFDDVFARLIALQNGYVGDVSPETCEKSPTVKAIVTAITRRFAVTPVHVYRKGVKDGRATKEILSNHPVESLLAKPNNFQTRCDFWQDASSWFARYGRFHAWKMRGSTGPIRQLVPLSPRYIKVEQDPTTWDISFVYQNAEKTVYPLSKMLYARGASRDGYCGDSPVQDVAESIALEIAAEKFGNTFFANGALPLLVFKYMQGSQGFKKAEDEKQFVDDFQRILGGDNRHKGFILPKGIEIDKPVDIQNDKSQFLETRKYQRTVIAGAWGVPPHLVGDLERATFNNVEQQGLDFTGNVIMPIGQAFEASMERDLLTDADRAQGVIIRFNFDSILRADFKSRQEGLQIQRQNGVINANEWREYEGMNPIDETDGGDEYIYPANMNIAGEPPDQPGDSTDSSGAAGNA